MHRLTRCLMRKALVCFSSIIILGFGTTGVAQTAGRTLKKITAFDLPGPAGKRFDYLTIGQDDQYLISAHLAASQPYVIDLRRNQVVAVVTNTPASREWNTFLNSRSSTHPTRTTTRLVWLTLSKM